MTAASHTLDRRNYEEMNFAKKPIHSNANTQSENTRRDNEQRQQKQAINYFQSQGKLLKIQMKSQQQHKRNKQYKVNLISSTGQSQDRKITLS
mmetsp:Transcript_36001/g.55304  ORF Transcript_36001/g.55304 Transcript_36001/m.55304 type:complete len:93 (+) Transcript_36001:250-528(+)